MVRAVDIVAELKLSSPPRCLALVLSLSLSEQILSPHGTRKELNGRPGLLFSGEKLVTEMWTPHESFKFTNLTPTSDDGVLSCVSRVGFVGTVSKLFTRYLVWTELKERIPENPRTIEKIDFYIEKFLINHNR